MRFLLVSILILLLSACLSKPDCIITTTNLVKITFKKITSDSANSVLFSSISVSGTDSLFQNKNNEKVSSVTLPVDPRAKQTTFKFTYKSGPTSERTDSVTVMYIPLNVVISPECGGYVYYTNLSVLSTSFVEIPNIPNPKVVNSQLSTSVSVNLQIKL